MTKHRILIIDDDRVNLLLASKVFGTDYELTGVGSGEEGLSWLSENNADIILMDINMPGMDGFEVFEALKTSEKYRDIPVIFLTAEKDEDAEVKCIEMGAFDFIRKPFIPTIARIRVKRCIEACQHHALMEIEIKEKTQELHQRQQQIIEMTDEIISTLASTIDAKDTYTKGHSTRVARYSAILAQKLGWPKDAIMNLKYMALLHDIGKIGIPDQVLNKPGKLTSEEFDIIKSHTVIGTDILQDVKSLDGVHIVARHHHERYDGLGYPDGLAGEDIPLNARIVGIADAFDAMSSDRVYRKALPRDIILKELTKGRGTQFDPQLLDVFVQLYEAGELDEIVKTQSLKMKQIIDEIDAFAEEIYTEEFGIERKNRFSNICEHMQLLQSRYNSKFTLVVISFKPDEGKIFDSKELADAMQAMEYGIVNNIEPGDICKRVGPERFMILLFKSKSEDAGALVDKFLSNYYRNNFKGDIKPYYKIADIGASKAVNRRRKVMIVDDNSMNLRMAEHALADDFEVIKANSGSVALDVLPGSGVDLILLDVLMPNMNGFEVYDKIKAMEDFKDIPIGFLTADTDSHTILKIKSLKVPFISKPFAPQQLLDTVSKML